MSPETAGILGIAFLVVLFLLRMPIAFSMAFAGFAGFAYLSGLEPALMLLARDLYDSFTSYSLSVIPMFILMGCFAFASGISQRLYETTYTWFGALRGGLTIATVMACAFFAAICGSTAATAATMGKIALPEMRKYKYDPTFATGTVAAAGTLGTMIPPSTVFIVYGVLVEESIGKLFIAGVIPGLVLTLILIVFAVYRSRRGGYVRMEPASWQERLRVTRKNIWGIALPFLILGGIYTGVFTPTEAAAIGLVYSLFITLVIYRTIRLRDLPNICLNAVGTSCMIAMIICGALLFGRVMTMLETPQKLTALIIQWQLSPITFVLAMNVLMLILGCILETVSIIMLTMPLVAPILDALKIDPIWYAIVLTVNMEMALVTPPVGMNLYVINGLDKDIRMAEVIRGVAPFILLMMGFLIFTMLFPPMSTWLPSMMK